MRFQFLSFLFFLIRIMAGIMVMQKRSAKRTSLANDSHSYAIYREKVISEKWYAFKNIVNNKLSLW